QWMGIFHLVEKNALWIAAGVAAVAAFITLYRYRPKIRSRLLRRKAGINLETQVVKVKEPSK
ncbi:alkaline phosphatase, partial [Paenibacillus riograndensis]